MKLTLVEHEGCFSIDLQAETMQEAAQLTRMGVDGRKKIRSISLFVQKEGGFSFNLVIPKHHRANSYIPKRR